MKDINSKNNKMIAELEVHEFKDFDAADIVGGKIKINGETNSITASICTTQPNNNEN